MMPAATSATAGTKSPAQAVRTLVPVRREGGKPPIFCVTAGYGHVLTLAGLGRSFPADQPFYALQPPWAEAIDLPELVRTYAGAVRSVQPHGPYVLSGFCSGGLLALQVAHELRTQGETTALLVLLDTPHEIGALMSTLYPAIRRPAGAVATRLPGKVPRKPLIEAFFNDRGFRTHIAALRGHRAPSYDGRALLIAAEQGMFSSVPSIPHWQRLTDGRIEVRSLPTDHSWLLRPPHAGAVVDTMKDALASVIASS